MNQMICYCVQATWLLSFACFAFVGCKSQQPPAKSVAATAVQTSPESSTSSADEQQKEIPAPSQYEVNPTALLENCLPEKLLDEGWVRLFDGQSLFGWSFVGNANWRVEDGTIRVDEGDPSFLCTNFQLADYELKVDFRCDEKTNSGIFLRTPMSPLDVAKDSLELNIAPPANPFPTGSFVKRQKLEPMDLGDLDPTIWHTFHVRLDGDRINVSLDDKPILEMTDATKLGRGFISLQHNQGRVEFRNVLLRPISRESLSLDKDWEKDWIKSEKDKFEVSVTEEGLNLKGGLGQLQSKKQWSDFVLQAVYKLAKPEVNSGIFFRCVPGQILDGYECQLNHAVTDADPLRPVDAGAGAIFRRQPARIVIGDGTKFSHVTVLAVGNQFATWVNGVQVTDFVDSRPADENPRKGSRLAAGPISLQGHDATTDVTFKSMSISPCR